MSGHSINQKADGTWNLERNSDEVIVQQVDTLGATANYAQQIITHTATGTITQQAHAGRINLLGEVGGDAIVTLTLPAATATGAVYRFIVSVVNTSSYVIKVANAADTIDGQITTASIDDTPDLAQPWVTAATSDTITLNGTTTGGVAIGDEFTITDIASGQFVVKGATTTSGTEATPFSATVT